MSSIYGSVDYGTEARATLVAAAEFVAPHGTLEVGSADAGPNVLYQESIEQGWEWPSDSPEACMDAINMVICNDGDISIALTVLAERTQ